MTHNFERHLFKKDFIEGSVIMLDQIRSKNQSLLMLFFVLACLFPWVSFRLNSMDTQPWILLIGISYLAWILIRSKISIKTFLLLPLSGMILSSTLLVSMFFFDSFDANFSLLRGVSGYLIFILIFIVFSFIYKEYGFPKKVFYIANIIWLLVGLIQILVDPYFFDSIVHVRTSVTRGVTGLSPEPTFYGFFLFFLNVIYLIQFNYRLHGLVRALFILNIIFIFFVAQSSSIILLLFVGVLFVLLHRLNLLVILLLLIAMSILVFALNYFVPNSRIINILGLLFDGGPLFLLSIDESVFARVMSVFYPYYWGLTNYLVPGGFSSIGTLPSMELNIGEYDFVYNIQGKIMSYFGSVFYELGVFSFLVIYLFFNCIYDKTFKSVLEFVYLFFCLQFALTIAFSLIPILLVIFYFRKNFNFNNGAGLYVQR